MKQTSTKQHGTPWGSLLGNGLLVVGTFWMVLAVAPSQVQPRDHVATSDPDSRSLGGENSKENSTSAGKKRVMPSPTERELTKLCFARSEGPHANSVVAAWRSEWSGELGDVIRDGGLNLNWKCTVLGFPNSGKWPAAPNQAEMKSIAWSWLIGLETQPHPSNADSRLSCANSEEPSQKEREFESTCHSGCKTRVTIDSDRFLTVR